VVDLIWGTHEDEVNLKVLISIRVVWLSSERAHDDWVTYSKVWVSFSWGSIEMRCSQVMRLLPGTNHLSRMLFLPLTKIVLEEYRDHKVQLRYCRRESLQPRPLDTCHCVSLRKSVSSGCLNSADWMNRSCSVRPKLLDFQGLDFEAAFGLRMAYSEGDIQVWSPMSSSDNDYLLLFISGLQWILVLIHLKQWLLVLIHSHAWHTVFFMHTCLAIHLVYIIEK
jgi:hypothetical protein